MIKKKVIPVEVDEAYYWELLSAAAYHGMTTAELLGKFIASLSGDLAVKGTEEAAAWLDAVSADAKPGTFMRYLIGEGLLWSFSSHYAKLKHYKKRLGYLTSPAYKKDDKEELVAETKRFIDELDESYRQYYKDYAEGMRNPETWEEALSSYEKFLEDELRLTSGRWSREKAEAPDQKELKTLNKMNYSIYEAADILGVHHNTIRHMIHEGSLNAKKIRGQWRIKKEDIIGK